MHLSGMIAANVCDSCFMHQPCIIHWTYLYCKCLSALYPFNYHGIPQSVFGITLEEMQEILYKFTELQSTGLDCSTSWSCGVRGTLGWSRILLVVVNAWNISKQWSVCNIKYKIQTFWFCVFPTGYVNKLSPGCQEEKICLRGGINGIPCGNAVLFLTHVY